MLRNRLICLTTIVIIALPGIIPAQVPSAEINKIKDVGMNHSQAMNTMLYLTDIIGGRLTNSPAQKRANRWTKEQFEKWGLQNAKIDSWGKFGRSWELKQFSINIVAPEYIALRAYPKAWSPGTNGQITGSVVYIDANSISDLAKYKGKLKGAIVLIDEGMKITPGFEPTATRRTDSELLNQEFSAPPVETSAPREITAEQRLQAQVNLAKYKMIYEEGAAALLDSNWGVDSGTLRVMGANVAPDPKITDPFTRSRARPYQKETPATIPQFVVEVEQYNRLLRRVKGGEEFKIQFDLAVNWDDSDQDGYNTIAEIPGSDLKDEVVMIGGHLDSWHAGTGATDNGAGTTVAMEAMRILAASGLKPRRTIRVALWTGEEQGLLGSRGYVAKTFGKRNADGSLSKTAEYDNFAAYFNLDNGTGQIRGVYSQGNMLARDVFRRWLEPFAVYGASTTSISNTGGTDHLAFDAIGLPGFQFIQDSIEYGKRTWHTSQDVADRTLEEDLKRSAVIMASFAYNAAMSDKKFPRKSDDNPFAGYLANSSFKSMVDDALTARHNFAICGHDIDSHEIPTEFPRMFALRGDELNKLAE